MVRIGLMARAFFRLSRRDLMAGFGASALVGAASRAWAQARTALQAKPAGIALRPGSPETPVWSIAGSELRFRRGETVTFDLGNELPAPVAFDWRGLDGAPAVAPLTGRPPLTDGAKESVA